MKVEPRSPSRSAILTAAARALHREEPPPWVLDDEVGLKLAGAEGTEIIRLLRAELPAEDLRAFSRWTCIRARVPEDVVDKADARGVRQYVILGAGLDSFAHRRSDLVERLRVFEVDHPASQAWKRRRLQELGLHHPANLIYEPVDFETQTLRDGLVSAGFAFGAPAIFSWIGVTMYLSQGAIRSTLATIRTAAATSRILLTYNRPLAALASDTVGAARTLRRIVQEMGEPFVSVFEPAEIAGLLLEVGFEDIADFGPDEARQTYFAGRSDVLLPDVQWIVMATVPR